MIKIRSFIATYNPILKLYIKHKPPFSGNKYYLSTISSYSSYYKTTNQSNSNNYSLISKILGPDLNKLDPVIRDHYEIFPNQLVNIKGVLDIYCHPWMKFFLKLAGPARALIPFQSMNAITNVYHWVDDKEVMHWKRTMFTIDHKPHVFYSKWVYHAPNQVVEYVRLGLGVKLKVSVKDGAIVLDQLGYIIKIGKFLIPLPLPIILGYGYAEEKTMTNNTYNLSFIINHYLFGKIFGYSGNLIVYPKKTNNPTNIYLNNEKKTNILILGGYGFFGKRITQALAKEPNLNLIIGGRTQQSADDLIKKLNINLTTLISSANIDITNKFSDYLDQHQPNIVINTCGPFQNQDYSIAQQCINNKIHYIDLADADDFVVGIKSLNTSAKQNNVLIVSGASTVPSISATMIDFFNPEFSKIHRVDYCISPSNKTSYGVATVKSLLSYIGKPYQVWENNQFKTVYGWQDLHRENFPYLGTRWVANCRVPDVKLFPQYYPDIDSFRFYAGLELKTLHHSLWGLSWLTRLGLIKNLDRYANLLHSLGLKFHWFGSDIGGMHMKISGIGLNGEVHKVSATWIADDGDGPQIPATPAVILVKKLIQGQITEFGARECINLFTLPEIRKELEDYNIQLLIDRQKMETFN